MKLENLMRNLRVLLRADAIIAEIHIRHIMARSGLMAIAALISVFALLMFDLAAYFALESVWGPVWSAAAIGVIDLLIALVLLVIAARIKPGRELDLATEIHESALEALIAEAKAGEMELANLTRMVRNPLDSALGGLVGPLASILLAAIRKRTQPKDEK